MGNYGLPAVPRDFVARQICQFDPDLFGIPFYFCRDRHACVERVHREDRQPIRPPFGNRTKRVREVPREHGIVGGNGS